MHQLNMSNETISSTVSPEASDAEKILFGYLGMRGSFLKYYDIEIVIYVITIITNAITVTLISCNRRLRVLSNLFFACLAVTDLFQGFFGIAFNALRILWYTYYNGEHSLVKVEGLLCLLVGWWQSTLFSYCSIMLISLERWFFIAHPFVHQRFYNAKNVIAVVAVAFGICVLGCVLVTAWDARSSNVGISFPLLHTIFSIGIVATYAHIILISYRQQRAIRVMTRRTTYLTGQYDRNNGGNNLNSNANGAEQVNVLSAEAKSGLSETRLKGGNKKNSVSFKDPINSTNGAEIIATDSPNRAKVVNAPDFTDGAKVNAPDFTDDTKVIATGSTNRAKVIATGSTNDAKVIATGSTNDAKVNAPGSTNSAKINAPGSTIDAKIIAPGPTNGAKANSTLPTSVVTSTESTEDDKTFGLSVIELGENGDQTVNASSNTSSPQTIGGTPAEKRKSIGTLLRSRNDTKTKEKHKDTGLVAHNWKAVRMSATVFCMYFCFMSPWIYYEFITAIIYGPRTFNSETSQALNTLTCLHFCSNFFVYSFQNRDFRRELSKCCVRVFGGCCPRLKNKVTDIPNVTLG